MVLSEILERSFVFRKSHPFEKELPPQVKMAQEHIRELRKKYSKEFEAVKNVVVEYDGLSILGATII